MAEVIRSIGDKAPGKTHEISHNSIADQKVITKVLSFKAYLQQSSVELQDILE
jgi:hypothetical protein